MAITTVQGAITDIIQPQEFVKVSTNAAVAGRFESLFYATGTPAAGAIPSSGLSGAILSSLAGQVTGQITFLNPTTGNTYLSHFSATVNTPGTLLLCDRLWSNSGIVVTATSAQTINSTTWPTRDITGGTSGSGVMIGLEVTATMGAGTPTLTMVYTNPKGIGSISSTTVAVTSAMIANSFIPIPLSSGDTGIQSIQSWTQSATMTSGSYSLIAYRMIARLDAYQIGLYTIQDCLSAGFPILYNGSVPFFLWIPNAAATSTLAGEVVFSQG